MDNVLKINHDDNCVKAVVTSRIKTAIEMCDYTSKVHVEQETRTNFSVFHEKLYKSMEKNNTFVEINYEFFKGFSDIICETTLRLVRNKTPAIEDPKLESELILGDALQEFLKYFGWVDWNKPEFDRECWEHSDFKDLLILKK